MSQALNKQLKTLELQTHSFQIKTRNLTKDGRELSMVMSLLLALQHRYSKSHFKLELAQY